MPKEPYVLFHGHGGRKSDVTKEAEGFRKMGYNTFQLDFRAHGASQGNTCTIGYYESEDVKLAYDFVKSKGEKNIVLWGISMGGAAVIKAIQDYPLKPNKMIVEMPFGSILEAAEGRIKLMGLPGEPLARLITFWGGVEHGFWAYGMKPREFAKRNTMPCFVAMGQKRSKGFKKEIDDIYGNIATQKKISCL
ncbi:MAG: alpha/beta fold hydrolase [Ferruginibacter sp.]